MSTKPSSVASKLQNDADRLNELIVDSMQDIKASKIVKLDLTELDDRPADFFIICEAESSVQVKSIAGNIYRRVKDELDTTPGHFEGKDGATWVLVDFFTTVAHVFHPDARAFYQIEELWGDARITEYADL